MSQPEQVRIGVIGAGNMGSSHARDLATRVPGARLAAVCDVDRTRADRCAAECQAPAYYSADDLLAQADLDAVVIATPHYAHTPLSIASLARGWHVLVEKPLAVQVADGRQMLAAYAQARQANPRLVFAIMFQQRTYSYWQKIKALLEAGALGRLARATWLITDWFRTQSYYDNGGWRATWRGEGGGVLLNQCPHNLDLYQWFFGLPARVTGFAAIGKYHAIEVEDEVTAYFEHANGMVGHLVTSTAESPGTNRLEVVGENGRLVFEDGQLTFYRNRQSMLEFIRTSPNAYDKVPGHAEALPCPPPADGGHARVLAAFVDAIAHGQPPSVQAAEGLNSLMLGNAIMLSQFEGRPVTLPLDEAAYAAHLRERIETSRFEKVTRLAEPQDLGQSFNLPGNR